MTVPEKQTLDQRSTALNMREIARQLGVSIASVSRALNNQPGVSEEMRQRIHSFVRESAYHLRPSLTPAQPTNPPATPIIAFIVHRHEETFKRDPFYPAILLGLEQEAAKLGYHVLVRSTTAAEETHILDLPLFRDHLATASIVVGPDIDVSLMRDLSLARIPLVLVDNVLDDIQVGSVEADNVSGALASTKHLIEHGYQQIVMIHGPLTWASVRDRVLGYHQAMWAAGLVPRTLAMKHTTRQDGRSAMQQVLTERKSPRAIVASNDSIALGAMEVAQAAGLRIPEDLAFCGYDDIPAALQAPSPLTTIHIPTERLGYEAAQWLFRFLQLSVEQREQFIPVRILVQNTLMIRQSCGCPAPS